MSSLPPSSLTCARRSDSALHISAPAAMVGRLQRERERETSECV